MNGARLPAPKLSTRSGRTEAVERRRRLGRRAATARNGRCIAATNASPWSTSLRCTFRSDLSVASRLLQRRPLRHSGCVPTCRALQMRCDGGFNPNNLYSRRTSGSQARSDGDPFTGRRVRSNRRLPRGRRVEDGEEEEGWRTARGTMRTKRRRRRGRRGCR
ncbi:hypothetical protein QYE76_030580 [Lolium multiflorum]|uniref:Uncharacterized protein n=1 Tax=Lolium multiflorum TaxID=4521 RepID=A0AAD8QQM4_LOLMU|nr:hypothetical protein QYE76_030580 [Lolium multiflorum]